MHFSSSCLNKLKSPRYTHFYLINEKIVHTKILIEHTRLYGTPEEGGDLLVFFQLLFVSGTTNSPNLFLYNS